MRIIDNKYLGIHDKIKAILATYCDEMGYDVSIEYRGQDWRADVMVSVNDTKYAFEIQNSPQTLKKTLERQSKYERDGVVGCWLFSYEKVRKSPQENQELENLPLFNVFIQNGEVWVSLKDRKTLLLRDFLYDFLNGRIKFCHKIKALPIADLNIIETECWKCHEIYHIYGLNQFRTACNTEVYDHEKDQLWGNKELLFNPEVIAKVKEYALSKTDKINLSVIKERYSNTVGKSYMSFGCPKCDAILGDWYYMHDALFASAYGDGVVDRVELGLEKDLNITQELPHWCHPGEHDFCE